MTGGAMMVLPDARRPTVEAIDLARIILLDALSGQPRDLGNESGPTVLVLVRHRF